MYCGASDGRVEHRTVDLNAKLAPHGSNGHRSVWLSVCCSVKKYMFLMVYLDHWETFPPLRIAIQNLDLDWLREWINF